jgi:hypothetical protein
MSTNQALPLRSASISAPSTTKSPTSDTSPRAQVSPPVSQPVDYFSTRRDSGNKGNNGSQGGVRFASLPTTASRSAQIFGQNSPNLHRGSIASSASPASPASPNTVTQSPGQYGSQSDSRRVSDALSLDPVGEPSLSRKSSTASVSFRPPKDPSLPQGAQRKTDGRRLRASSPSPVR